MVVTGFHPSVWTSLAGRVRVRPDQRAGSRGQLRAASLPVSSPSRFPSGVVSLVGIPVLAALLALSQTGWLFATQWPWSRPVAPPREPHPAIVRVCVEETDGMAYGSGTLIDVQDDWGLIVSNWHVVQNAAGETRVLFPHGFRATARVLGTDQDWDLAALLIRRPPVSPMPLAARAPRPGEPLTIAGYGSGRYQVQTGRCTQYVAPSAQHPFEMVEVSAPARQGDSGGPILNAAGELAGVLFGSNRGTTSGAYAGRVRRFINTVWPPRDGPEQSDAQLAGFPETADRPLQRLPEPAAEPRATSGSSSPMQSLLRRGPVAKFAQSNARTHAHQARSRASPSRPSPASDQESTLTWQDLAGDSLFEQCKTFLAILGSITLLAFLANLFTPSDSADQPENA